MLSRTFGSCRSGTLDSRIERGQTSQLTLAPQLQIASASGRIEDVAWTPDGQVVYVSYGADGSNVWLWEPERTGAEAVDHRCT